MDVTTFMITVYCFIDDWLKDKRLRQRGSQPTLSDSEVLTMEVVGECLGIDAETALYHYFRCHWAEWFPRLLEVERTTFTRQMANLWRVKEQLSSAGLSLCARVSLSAAARPGGLWL